MIFLLHHKVQPPEFQLEVLSLVVPCLGDAEVHLSEVFAGSQNGGYPHTSRSAWKSTNSAENTQVKNPATIMLILVSGATV